MGNLRTAGTVAAWVLAAGPAWAQMATADRIEGPGWWPTRPTASRQDYVGPDACAGCHGARAATQRTTAMARTAKRAADADILREHRRLTFRVGPYAYEIAREGERSVYRVTDGSRTASAPLSWAFGVGKVGQTYFFERDGGLHEGRVSYYDAPRALDFTPKRTLAAPRDLEEAMARPVGDPEARRCFGCHTTATVTGSRLDLDSLIPGVTCEACHGPGRGHVMAMEDGRIQDGRGKTFNPRRLDPADSVDFCGACHATFWDVKLAAEGGIAALRSQPHRLQSSRCWGEGDARLTCVACHDPHQPLVREARAYDSRCLACHAAMGSATTSTHPRRACKVAARDCITCHMPKYEVPEMHSRFTDHLIRVVAPPPGGAAAGPRR